jgi:hypothetical protein
MEPEGYEPSGLTVSSGPLVAGAATSAGASAWRRTAPGSS